MHGLLQYWLFIILINIKGLLFCYRFDLGPDRLHWRERGEHVTAAVRSKDSYTNLVIDLNIYDISSLIFSVSFCPSLDKWTANLEYWT